MPLVRIGLLRHFEVTLPFPTGWVTSRDLQEWRDRYDRADVTPRALDLGGIEWQRCLSSDMPRARITARAAFAGPIEERAVLREAEVHDFGTGSLRLPVPAWHLWLRASWFLSLGAQRAARDDFRSRVDTIARDVLATAEVDTLLVGHAGMMIYLSRALRRLGYAGPEFSMPRHGVAYVFSRSLPVPPTHQSAGSVDAAVHGDQR